MGPVEGINANADKRFINPQGTNIKRTGDIITLIIMKLNGYNKLLPHELNQ